MAKKTLFFLTAVFSILFASCGAKKATETQDKKVLKIGVIQLVEHKALDASYQGFVAGLKDAGFVDGDNIKIDYQNAQGEQANCVTIANKLVNDKSDLILAIATPAAQAVANITKDIPILVTAVTDPASAHLVVSNDNPQTNVSGTSDLNPIDAQMALLQKLLPNAKKVAMLYCSSEQNSIFQVDLAKQAASRLGLECVDATVSNSNEIQQVVQSLVGKVDAIYAPTDNMIAAGMATVAMVATPNKLPIICGEENMVLSGGLATYGVNYFELGKQTATMAVKILKDGEKPANMPIQYLQKCDFFVNKQTAKLLDIEIPSDLQ